MTFAADASGETVMPAESARPYDHHRHLIEGLIGRLPGRLQASTRWLLRPSSRWARFPAGILFICGGLLSILPLLGLWMLPLGLLLLAEDCRRSSGCATASSILSSCADRSGSGRRGRDRQTTPQPLPCPHIEETV